MSNGKVSNKFYFSKSLFFTWETQREKGFLFTNLLKMSSGITPSNQYTLISNGY